MSTTRSRRWLRPLPSSRTRKRHPHLENLEERLVLSEVNLLTPGASGMLQGAIYRLTSTSPTGTGNIHSFVRIDSNTGTEQGYNTGARPLEFDENTSPQFTRNLNLSDVPKVDIDGVTYREFLLDVNQTNADPLVSLDQVQVFLESSPDETGYMNGSGGLETPIYDMQAGSNDPSVVKIDSSFGAGSGQGDMLLDVPDSLFTGPNQFVYLYSHFGGLGVIGTGNDAVSYEANDGFEEWAVQNANNFLAPTVTTNIVLDSTGHIVTGGSVSVGSSVHDTAVVSVDNTEPTPTGTITYSFYNTIDATGSPTSTVTVGLNADGSVPDSTSVLLSAAGGYSFRAHYSGDSNYPAVDSPVEPLTAIQQLFPVLVTTQIFNNTDSSPVSGPVALGTTVYDTTSVVGVGPAPTGTLTYNFYLNDSGTGTPVSTQTVAIGSHSPLEGPLGAGSYSFTVHYSGDANHSSGDSDVEPLEVMKADTTTTTKVEDANDNDITGTSVALGTTVHDDASVGTQVSTFGIGGMVTYTLHVGSDGKGTVIGTSETVSVGTEATPVILGPGDYSYTVQFSGDDNYNGSDGPVEPFHINAPPQAMNDAYDCVNLGSTYSVPNAYGQSVLNNDSDPDSGPQSLSAVLDTGPSHASAFTFNSDGTFSYTPSAAYFAALPTGSHPTDSFTYHAFDGLNSSTSATVTLTINRAPVAVADSFGTQLNVIKTGNVLTNDSDPDGTLASEQVAVTAVNGSTSNVGQSVNLGAGSTLVLNANGSFSYTPGPDFHGTQSFSYTITDHCGLSSTVAVTLNVTSGALTQGYWKNHASAWPVQSLTIGGVSYSQSDIIAIMNMSTGTGTSANAILILFDQLVAAKLNVLSGVTPDAADMAAIADGDQAIKDAATAAGIPMGSTKLVGNKKGQLVWSYNSNQAYVVTSTTLGQRMINDGNVLNSFNNTGN